MRIKIISDGINHQVMTESGEPITNVKSALISKIEPDKEITALLEVVNMPVELIAEENDVNCSKK